MLEQTEHKKNLKLKSIFRPQTTSNNNSDVSQKSVSNRQAAVHLKISPPVLQHSTSIYSLVSPIRTGFTNVYSPNNSNNRNELQYELYQPLSPPPPIPQQRSPWSTMSTSTSNLNPSKHKRVASNKCELEKPMHPLDFTTGSSKQHENNFHISRNTGAHKTVATDSRDQQSVTEVYVNENISKANRRHSCSSTAFYKQQQQEQAVVAKQSKTDLNHVKSLRSKLRERRRSSKVGSSYSTAATIASIESPCIEPSKSAPMRKVKTYNVPKKETAFDVERQKRMQELEDLISGRRGSTLKLTLTPKGLS